MKIENRFLGQVLVSIYPKRGGTLMPPVFGVLLRSGKNVFACTVAHLVDDRDDGYEIWDGIHPDRVREFGLKSKAQCLLDMSRDSLLAEGIIDNDADLLAILLPEYHGPSLEVNKDIVDGEIGLLRPVLIAFPEYHPDEQGVLQNSTNGIAGLISQESSTHCIVTADGNAGMSGSIAVVRNGEELQCVGLYTGTPRTTPFTPKCVEPLAQVVKIGAFIGQLSDFLD